MGKVKRLNADPRINAEKTRTQFFLHPLNVLISETFDPVAPTTSYARLKTGIHSIGTPKCCVC